MHGDGARMAANFELENSGGLRTALAASGVSTWETDLETGEIVLSEGWAALLGAPPGITRTTLHDVMALVHPHDLAVAVQRSMDVVRGLVPSYSAEHRVRASDGSWRWVISQGKVIERDAVGRALRMAGI